MSVCRFLTGPTCSCRSGAACTRAPGTSWPSSRCSPSSTASSPAIGMYSTCQAPPLAFRPGIPPRFTTYSLLSPWARSTMVFLRVFTGGNTSGACCCFQVGGVRVERRRGVQPVPGAAAWSSGEAVEGGARPERVTRLELSFFLLPPLVSPSCLIHI